MADSTLRGQCRGQLFINGALMYRMYQGVAGSAPVSAGSWALNAAKDGLLVKPPASVDLTSAFVELAVRERVFAPSVAGLGYLTLRGLIFEHAGNGTPWFASAPGRPQHGMVGVNGGHHWLIENCIIRFANTVGLNCAQEGSGTSAGYHCIRNNIISYNGLCGLAGIQHRGTQVIANVFEHNSQIYTPPSVEDGAIKFHQLTDGYIAGNLFRYNDDGAIWLDWNNGAVTIERNVFAGNKGYDHNSNILVEHSASGPFLFDNNIMDWDYGYGLKSGIFLTDWSSCNITFAHNLGISDRANQIIEFSPDCCGRDPWTVQNNTVANNMFLAPAGLAILFKYGDYASRFSNNTVDYNLQNGVISGMPAYNTHSQTGAITDFKLNRDSLTVEFTLDSTAWKMGCPKQGGIAQDFLGNPMPAFLPLPGAFQNIMPGKNKFAIWPISVQGFAFDKNRLPQEHSSTRRANPMKENADHHNISLRISNGTASIVCSGATGYELNVLTLMGRRVASFSGAGPRQFRLSIPLGIYVIRANIGAMSITRPYAAAADRGIEPILLK
jgi:hypothetical protein